jgi:hypothetical protein
MGYIIGESGAFSTWGTLRGAVIQGSPPTRFFHNELYYDTGGFFKTEQAQGLLVRGRFSDTLFPADLTVTLNGDYNRLEVKNFDDRYHSDMIGQVVENEDAETFTITADAFVPPDYQDVGPISSNQVTDITLFDPIT